jgi:putative lipoic acid-binding regulatory protein
MGVASEKFQIEILEIVHLHADPVSSDQISSRASGKGNYLAITVVINATGENQLSELFQALKANKNVKLVL